MTNEEELQINGRAQIEPITSIIFDLFSLAYVENVSRLCNRQIARSENHMSLFSGTAEGTCEGDGRER